MYDIRHRPAAPARPATRRAPGRRAGRSAGAGSGEEAGWRGNPVGRSEGFQRFTGRKVTEGVTS